MTGARVSTLVLSILALLVAALPAAAGGSLAADGLTLMEEAAASPSPASATPGIPPALPAANDLVYFEEDGGGGGPRGLYDFDSGSGVSTLRTGVGGSERFFSLAIQPGTGTVYAADPILNDIFTVDPDTGVVTFVVSLSGVSTVADITFDPAGGRLYGGERNAPLDLYTIDLATGNVTTIGTMVNVRSGLTFAPDGTLYGFALDGTLYEVDKNTAAETLIGGGGGPGLVEDATARDDGVLFLTDFFGQLYEVDPATGVNTLVGDSGSGSGLLGIMPQPGAGLSLAVSGACPGTITIDISGATPGGPLGILGALAEGSDLLAGGPCAGTQTGLDAPSFLGTLTADGNGDVSVMRSVPQAACGRFLQAVDGTSCAVSNVDQVP